LLSVTNVILAEEKRVAGWWCCWQPVILPGNFRYGHYSPPGSDKRVRYPWYLSVLLTPGLIPCR